MTWQCIRLATDPIDPGVQEGEAVSVNIYHHLLSHVSRTELERPMISTVLLGHLLTPRLSTCRCVLPAPCCSFQQQGSLVLHKSPHSHLTLGRDPEFLKKFCFYNSAQLHACGAHLWLMSVSVAPTGRQACPFKARRSDLLYRNLGVPGTIKNAELQEEQ